MKYKFLVFGAGAIGTYIGLNLLLQGHQVAFLEREKDLNDLRKNGLKMEVEGKQFYYPTPDIITDLDTIKTTTFDLAILALKTYHLDDVLPNLIKLKEFLPPILCLQNGVESERILGDVLGKDQVISGTVTTAVDRIEKGYIIVSKSRGLGVAGNHPLIPGLFAAFLEAGLKPIYYSQSKDMKWSKLILNLLGNSSSAILNMTASEIYSDTNLFRMERSQILETLSIMSLLGIKTVNLPGVPVRLLAFVLKYFPQILAQPILSNLIGSGRGGKMPSFHIDLHHKKGISEVSHLNGAVVKAGKRLGYPTPVNNVLFDVLTRLTNGKETLEQYDHKPEILLEEIFSNTRSDLSEI